MLCFESRGKRSLQGTELNDETKKELPKGTNYMPMADWGFVSNGGSVGLQQDGGRNEKA